MASASCGSGSPMPKFPTMWPPRLRAEAARQYHCLVSSAEPRRGVNGSKRRFRSGLDRGERGDSHSPGVAHEFGYRRCRAGTWEPATTDPGLAWMAMDSVLKPLPESTRQVRVASFRRLRQPLRSCLAGRLWIDLGARYNHGHGWPLSLVQNSARMKSSHL